MKITIFLILLIVLTQFLGCSTEPENKNPFSPDTTSQNFRFNTTEFGNKSTLNKFEDVWVFDENNIWAVGYLNSEYGKINIMRWDGKKWFPQYPYIYDRVLQGVWAADTNNVFFAYERLYKYENRHIVIYKMGEIETDEHLIIYKLWGTYENNIWGIGPFGSLVHYDGKKWKRINFDPAWHFYEITGNKYSGTGYAIARKNNSGFIIVELKDENTKIIYDDSKNIPSLKSADIKYYNDKLYLGVTDYASTKIWYYDLLTQEVVVQKTFPRKTRDVEIKQIELREGNDIYYMGVSMYSEFGLIHFNGIRYKSFLGEYQKSITFTGSHTDGNICAAVGYSYDKAFITIISRN